LTKNNEKQKNKMVFSIGLRTFDGEKQAVADAAVKRDGGNDHVGEEPVVTTVVI
jgi:hypothetical protein